MGDSLEFKICSQSVLDTTFPGIRFDSSGVAAPVSQFLRDVKPVWTRQVAEGKQLENTVERVKRSSQNSDYDSILGLSGGLDSSYMLHLAVKELGLRPLVFHVDGGWNTEGAVGNISKMVEKLGLDLYTEVIDWSEMREFQKVWFQAGVPHLDIPQDHAFIATLYRFAEKFGIRTILNGGNLSTEGIRNPLKYFYYGTDMAHIRAIMRFSGLNPLPSFPFSPVLRHKAYLRFVKGIRVVRLLDMVPYRKTDAERLLAAEYGWIPFRQKHYESSFTRFYEGYWLPTRFGFDPRTVQLSSLILTDQLTRKEALLLLEQPAMSRTEVERETDFICAKLQISSAQLSEFHSLPLRYYFDFPNRAYFFGGGARLLQIFGEERSIKE